MRYLLPLMLVLATCWASKYPISDNIFPEVIEEVLDDYRLPDNVVPINYVIELTPYLDTNEENNFTFVGYSEITLQVKKPTNTIIFHAKQLTFNSIKLTYKDNTTKDNELITSSEDRKKDEKKDFLIVTFKKEIQFDWTNLKLILNYTGILNDELRGFYRSSYQTGNETRWLATTHFEPVGARQAFPCWDEPAIKATFNIAINPTQPNYHAISNMQPKSTGKDGKTIFYQTPKMSTYLVAFVISDYEKNGYEEGNFSVWTRPDAINSTDVAFEIGQETLAKLVEFTGIPYYSKHITGMKLDQISILDFVAGAMENWGLVTYRESALLYTENKSTTLDKQSIATVIAHEFSHQWFGNLVTCDWWDYIWLNEGFATFFQYYITDQVVQSLYSEDWRLLDQFVIKNLQASAFVIDATTKTRPLNSEIITKTPAQIQGLFDDIAYQKGASILRMLQKFLTDDIFQKGLKLYLTENSHKSVTSDKLLHAIQKTIDVNNVTKVLPDKVSLHDIMNNWLNKPGYPVVTVKRDSKNTKKVNLIQERFFLVKPAKQDTTQWYIPVTYVTEEAPEDVESLWMKPKEVQTLELNETKWILFNKDQTGYYRVNYDVANWHSLAEYLKSNIYYKNISDTNRAQLIDDALNLARAGYLPYNSSLKITEYLSKEVDYIPWYATVRAFDYLNDVLWDAKEHDKFRAIVANYIEAFAKTVDYTKPEGTHIEKLGKILALNTACKYGQKDCEDFAKKELEEWLKKEENKLSPDLRRGIICAGLRNANAETWNKALKRYGDTKDKDERADILAGLGCAVSAEIANKFLDLSIQKTPSVDVFSAMNSIAASNTESVDILLKFIKAHINEIKKEDENSTKLSALLNKLANKVTTNQQYAELSLIAYGHLQDFKNFAGLTQAIENLAWIESHRAEVEEWIKGKTQEDKDNSASSFTLASCLLIIPVLLARFN